MKVIYTDGRPTIACGAGDDLARARREELASLEERIWPEYEARMIAFEQGPDLTADDLYETK